MLQFPISLQILYIYNFQISFHSQFPKHTFDRRQALQILVLAIIGVKKMEGMQTWISKHKLTTIGTVWASAIGASLAYSHSKTPFKPSLRLIHARMHAQALTLAVLSGAAVYQYYEKRVNEHGESATTSDYS